MIDYTAGKFWLDVSHWVAVLILGVWGYLRTKDKDNDAAVQEVAKKLASFIEASRVANESQNLRLTALTEKVSHMPTEREVSRLSNDLAALDAKVEGMSDLLKRVEHQTNVISEHLLNR